MSSIRLIILAQMVVQAIHNCKEELIQYMPPEGSELPAGKAWLLFSFVTNTAGFDTGVAISNVSADPIATVHQSGCVRLHFYGSNAPAAIRSSPVFPGTVYTNLASYMSPNFQGYIVAECDFYP